MGFSIAIDGPAGAGKSTIAKRVASALSFLYVDTGAMYRAIAYDMLRRQIDLTDEEAVSKACASIEVNVVYVEGEQQVLLNGENVTAYIRTQEVGNAASAVGAYPAVREKLLKSQRRLAANADIVMDGRDIGTCVLPNANLKIYLTASPHVRAKRRFMELTKKEIDCKIEEIEQDIIKRDNRDMHRAVAPLKKAEDAVVLDSSDRTIEQVTERILSMVRERYHSIEY